MALRSCGWPHIAVPQRVWELLVLGPRLAANRMTWSEETLDQASKKELVQFLQKWATKEFLKHHKLAGQEKAITKKAKLPALREAYTLAMSQPKQHLTQEGYDEVRAIVFGKREEQRPVDAALEARDAISDRLAKLGLSQEAQGPEVARGAAPEGYSGPWLDDMPLTVLVCIMHYLGGGAAVRTTLASSSPKLRRGVLRAAPLAWRDLNFLDDPERAAKLTNRALHGIAALSGTASWCLRLFR